MLLRTEVGSPLTLSPIARPSVLDLTLGSSTEEDDVLAPNFIYFRPRNRINDTELSDIANQGEIDRVMRPIPGWIDLPLNIKVYIDDRNSIEKIKQINSISIISEGKRDLKVHSPKTETFFKLIYKKAEEIKMLVNQKKTQMLCISASTDTVVSYMRPNINGVISEICCKNSLKIVGFYFDNRPTVNCHLNMMCTKFRAKLGSMRVLKKAGLGRSDLIKIYQCTIRPVVEFAAATYGPMLTQELGQMIESLQLRVMKIIYGNNVSYRSVIENTDIETLESRRDDMVQKFAIKTSTNERFNNRWFPKNHVNNHLTRFQKPYLEEFCRTQQLYKSPIFTMRRILNKR